MNSLILGKYASKKLLQDLIEKIDTSNFKSVIIIVKSEDIAPDSPMIIKHSNHMMGDVCDLLWEASQQDQDESLLISSITGVMAGTHSSKFCIDNTAISIYCDEPTYASFKFDGTGSLIDTGDLPGRATFQIYFPKTSDFVELSEKIILSGKIDGNVYLLKTVINQAILDSKAVNVTNFLE